MLDGTADEVREKSSFPASWGRDERTFALKGAEYVYTEPEIAPETKVLRKLAMIRNKNDGVIKM